MITATAPGRCGIVGNPTDMYGGTVLSISTRERARCVLSESDVLEIASSGDSAVISTRDDLQLRGDKLDIARAALQWFDIDPATACFSLDLSTEIPMQAGMAGSTALIVTLVGAFDRWLGLNMHPWALAETARKIESRVMRIVCGLQDQHMAVFGGLNYMDFAGKQQLEQQDDEPLATIEPLQSYVPSLPLLTANTGIRHHSGTVHRTPRERWLAGETLVIESFQQIAQLARRGKRALLAGDWPALGALMNENHELISRLGGSGEANDRLIAAARRAGAWGAKLAGAGGGGTIIALAEDQERLCRALLEAGAVGLMEPAPLPGLMVSGSKVGEPS